MLAPYRWIKDYADVRSDVRALADKMVMTGNGVEQIDYLGKELKNIVVGRIEKIEKHPDADRLRICRLDVGEDALLQIVTGGTTFLRVRMCPSPKPLPNCHPEP
jgi:phenylalanyl-tRNA synthetase beta chain